MLTITKTMAAATMASLVMASTALAGFTASTGLDPFTYTAPGTALTPAVGGTFSVANQPLSSYTPDSAADPQIVAGDVANFLFNLTLNVDSVAAGTGAVNTSGSYSIVYNFGPGISVSSGIAQLALTPIAGGFSVAAGSLTQTAGPANPAFRDLAYGNNANLVLQGGFINATTSQIALTLRQDAVVPEPATLGALASLGLLAGRRRR